MNEQDIYYRVAHRPQEEIDSFANRYDNFPEEVIPDIFRQTLSLEVENYRKSSSWGSSHVIYFVSIKGQEQPLVFRANAGHGEPEVVMLTEKLVTDKVLEIGLKTNKILHVDVSRKDFPFDFQIQEMLQGKEPEIDYTLISKSKRCSKVRSQK